MTNDELQNIDLNNPEFQDAWGVIQKTRRSVFLTGKAGTGKSTFLRYICANTNKKYVILAPTGIAAVNVGGQTMHSFFKIPFKPLLPDDPDIANISRLRKMLRYTKEKVKLIKELDLIIIDEISMVRADIIDFVDRVLRVYSGNMREPFGGKQLLLVGDIFQLEPVVTHDMRDILRRYYKNFFFFNARAFELINLVAIELRKIYRQTDNDFIAMLDRVRINRATAADIALLNRRYNPDYQEVNDNNLAVTLATRRDTVDSINDEHMQALKTPECSYEGVIEGDFPENSLPTAWNLVLKVGAQVIFIRNDKEGRWYNGTIGIVTRLDDARAFVALENGDEVVVLPEVWENMQYTYNEKEKKVEEKVLGTFMQIPLKPAWALTVHKSQGLTFNHVVLDFVGGAFTGGQTYVALSRCTSLEGITLLKPLSERDIIVSMAVVDFSRKFNNRQIIDEAMEQERANILYRRAVHAFDNHEFEECVNCFTEAMKIKDNLQNGAVKRLITKKLNVFKKQLRTIERLQQVIDSQQKLLHELALEYTAMGDQALDITDGVVEEGSVNYGRRLDDIAIRSALANYNKALRIAPDCIEAMIGKARLMMALDQLEQAENELNNALKLNKNCYAAHMTLAQLKEQERDIPAAIKAYKKAASDDRKQPEPHDHLQAIYERIGLDDLADEEKEIADRLRKAIYKSKSSTRRKKK